MSERSCSGHSIAATNPVRFLAHLGQSLRAEHGRMGSIARFVHDPAEFSPSHPLPTGFERLSQQHVITILTAGFFGVGFSMSYEVLKYGWFGWNKMPAFIAFRDGRPLRECRIIDFYANRAKLEVDRAWDIHNEFRLYLTVSSRTAFECEVVGRHGSSIQVEFRRDSIFEPMSSVDIRPDSLARGSSRQDLTMLIGLATRRRSQQGAIASALLVTAVASLLIALAVKLDLMDLQQTGYHLAGSTTSFFKKAPSEPPNSTRDTKKD